MTTRKPTVLSDMDGIFVDLFRYWLNEIEKDHGPEYRTLPEEITQWQMHKCGNLVKLGAKPVYDYLSKPGFFRNAPELPGALAGLKVLHDADIEVCVVSSPSGPISAKEKLEWISERMPWLPLNQVCLWNLKTKVLGDFLIDDHPQTLVDYADRHQEASVIGIEYPYNRHLNVPRPFGQETVNAPTIIGSYTDTAAAWANIVDQILITAERRRRRGSFDQTLIAAERCR